MLEAGEKLGRPLDTCEHAKDMMLESGFVDVVEIPFKWPQNGWPTEETDKDLGLWVQENFTSGLEAMSLALFTRGLGWTRQEVTVFMGKVRKAMGNRNIHAYWPVYVVYGKKPN